MKKSLAKSLLLSAVLSLSSLSIVFSSVYADTLLVGNKNDATVSFFDLKNSKIEHVIKTGIGPHEIAVSPDQAYAAIVNYGNRERRGDSITLIDIATAKVINTVTHEKLSSPHGIQWFKDNRHVLVTAERNKTIVKLNPFSGEIVGVADTQAQLSHMLVIAPNEKLAAVSNLGSGNVSIIDLEKFKLVKIIDTGEGAEGIDISPDGRQLWVTNRADDTVSVIDMKTLEVIKQLDSKSFPIRVKITPDQKYALVSNATSDSLNVFDTVDFALIKSITLKNFKDEQILKTPIGILIDNDSQKAFIAHTNSHRVAVVDLNQLVQTRVIDAGPVPDGMGYVSKIPN